MDFRSTLQMLKQRRPVNILLAHPENAPRRCPKCRKPLEDVVAESGEWFWESLAAGGDSIAKTKSEELLETVRVFEGISPVPVSDISSNKKNSAKSLVLEYIYGKKEKKEIVIVAQPNPITLLDQTYKMNTQPQRINIIWKERNFIKVQLC
ncbi:hypothetical protein YC2023_102902 [Brassica napus]